jgi:formamidopyrimidine-DNA glycosylase
MPELPEVETICWRLREGGHGETALVGRTLLAVHLPDPAVVVGDARILTDMLTGATVTAVWRRAKWIVVEVITVDEAAATMLIHLKMTGDVHVRPPGSEAPRFVRLKADLDDGSVLCFTDPRRFGHVELCASVDDAFKDLGPEPLDDAFTARALRERLRGRRPIKATLLDQAIVAGLGNIYVDESLWLARIHPQTRTDALGDDDVVNLHRSIRHALRASITASKDELAWRYENRGAPSPFQVYDRGGEPCLRCGAPLATTTVAGRTTVFCPTCQEAPAV